MKKNYDQLATDLLTYVGGKENITFLVHCMTRLRFNLKDQSRIQKKEIEELPDVLGTKMQNNQFQIVIGENVQDVYDAICTIAQLEKEVPIDETEEETTSIEKKKHPLFASLFEFISGCFAPVVTAFAGAGIIKGILTLLTTYTLIQKESGIYFILNIAADATFYFLPFLLAFSAAKKLKTNEVLALILAGIYMYPTIAENAGQNIEVLGLQIPLIKYASSVVPILLSVWVMSYLYRFLSKHTIHFLRVIVVPIGTLLIMAPLSLMLFGPLGYNVGIYVGKLFAWLFNLAPILGGIVVGATRPLVVFTGTHMALAPIMLNNIDTLGYDMLGPVHCVATMSAAGMAFGAFLRFRKATNKSAGFSAFISAFIGITEPALYSIAFRYKQALIALIIGGGIAGGFVALMGAKAMSYAMPSILSLPVYAGYIPTMLIGLVLGFVITASLTYLFGLDEDKGEQ